MLQGFLGVGCPEEAEVDTGKHECPVTYVGHLPSVRPTQDSMHRDTGLLQTSWQVRLQL